MCSEDSHPRHLPNDLFNNYIVGLYYSLTCTMIDVFMDMLSNSLKTLEMGIWKGTGTFPGATKCLQYFLNTYSQVYMCQLHPLYKPRAFASWYNYMFSSFILLNSAPSILSNLWSACPPPPFSFFFKENTFLFKNQNLSLCYFTHQPYAQPPELQRPSPFPFSNEKMFKDSFYRFSFR